MKKSIKTIALLLLLLLSNIILAQVGIGTTTPAISSILELKSTSQGFLTPRMTTIQKNAIPTPANGLMVYDTDLKSFYYYDTIASVWIRISSNVDGRIKYKLIKSTDVLSTILAAELVAGGGSSYKLDGGTLYEINGLINVNFPIDLNNAYVIGLDSSDDQLVRASGDLFVGAMGGSIRVLTLIASSGKVFNLDGAATQSMILRDCIVRSSANVGSIKGFNFVFLSIVLFTGNANGIVYENINKLLLSNVAWFGGNGGTYEKLVGTFGLVTKQGGFSELNSPAICAFDVSSNPIILGDAVIEGTVFTGSNSAGFVNKYTTGSYPGFSFNNSWIVRCAGLPVEADAVATGNLFDPSNTASTLTNAAGAAGAAGLKLVTNPTSATNQFRFDSPYTGRLTYRGKKTRTFQASASISFIETTSGANTTYVFYFVKILADGITVVPLPETETYNDTNSGFIQSFPVTGSVTLNKDESVEVYLKRLIAGPKTNINTYSFNITVQ